MDKPTGKKYCSLVDFFRIRLSQRILGWFGGLKFGRGFLVAGVTSILIFGVVIAGMAGNNEPGSPEDPLVTKSYVDAQVKAYAGKGEQWQVADLLPGQQLIGSAGTEMIVRAGETLVVDPVGNAIPDLTAGTNIMAGKAIATNHHLLIPRSDGRGVKARAKAVVMYKGEVKVK